MVKPMCAFLPQETPKNCNDWATVHETEESGETSFFFNLNTFCLFQPLKNFVQAYIFVSWLPFKKYGEYSYPIGAVCITPQRLVLTNGK